METIDIHIQHKSVGFAMGKNQEGEPVFVSNGDLAQSSTVRGVWTGRKDQYHLAELFETYNNEEKLEELRNDNGLILTGDILEIISPHVFRIAEKWVFPHHRVRRIVDYLLQHRNLWDASKLHLVNRRTVVSSAIMFGLTFKSAMEKMQAKKVSTARLYCDKKSLFAGQGVVAEMLAHTYLDPDGFATLQVWQGVESEENVFYAHGRMNRGMSAFTHFDCAIIDYDISDRERIFRENKGIRSGQYQKLFQIDGESIQTDDIYELANRFFPLDNLIDEFFEIEPV